MQTSEIDYKTIYASLAALKKNAQFTYKQIGLSKDATKELVKHCRENSYITHNATSGMDYFNSTTARILVNQYGRCVNEIHKTRQMLRAVENKSNIQEAMYESKSNAYRAFSQAFPSAKVETKCEIGEEVSCRELHSSWGGVVEGGALVTVAIGWNKKIYEEGISVVQAGDGARFILDSKERKITRLNNDYIRCWAVRSVKRKHKKCYIENATVMKYDAGGDVVLSISDSFSKAESLIRRRIKDSAVDVLMEL